jgi:hypothetical protein
MSNREAVLPRVQVVIAFHQPLTTDESALEQLWNGPYTELLEQLGDSGTKAAVHFTGHMLDYLAKRREEVLLSIKNMAKAQKIEILGGLFYAPVPALLPELDVRGQVEMMSEYWQSLLGWAPQGFFLPELTWSVELPRLLQDSGLAYGFASASQVAAHGPHAGFGMIERGDQRLAAFVLDPNLSSALPSRPVEEWMDALVDRAQSQAQGVTTVWVRAEELVGAQKTAGSGWLQSWLAALGEASRVRTVLPLDSFQSVRPAVPLKLLDRCAPEIKVKLAAPFSDWGDLPRAFPEADTLYRRMLRASAKLRESIATMQDEELEDTWSDALATAQRLVFSAQAHDSYWTGHKPGLLDAELREAASSRLIRAESMLDALVQGQDDWIALEEQDFDGDLGEEALVCTRHLTAWVRPAAGGAVRALEPRLQGRNVLDLGARRAEGSSDPGQAFELRTVVLDEGASLAQLGAAPRPSWEVIESRIDEEGDCAYHLKVRTSAAPGLTVEKTILVPIDSAQLRIGYLLTGNRGAIVATEVPLHLSGELSVSVNGAPLGSRDQVSGLETLRVENAGAHVIEVACEPALDAWIQKTAGGFLLVPLLRAEAGAEAVITMTFSAPAAEEPAAAQEQEDGPEEEEEEDEEEAEDRAEEEVDGDEEEEEEEEEEIEEEPN